MDELLNILPCGFFSFADDGRIVQANETALQHLGYSSCELTGRKVEDILTLAGRVFYQTHFLPLIRLNGKAEEIFFSLLAKDGTFIPVLLNAARKPQEEDMMNHCVYIPVHQRKKYEEEILQAKKIAEDALHKNAELVQTKQQLEIHAEELDRKINSLTQKNHELQQFNRVVTHDLQEPLRKIITFTDILFQDNKATLTPSGLHSVNRILAACDRMRKLTDTLQKFVYFDAEPKTPSAVCLNRAFEIAAEYIVASTPELPEIDLVLEPLPVVEGYAEQLEKLFAQLLDNAIRFRDPQRKLTLRVQCRIIQQNSFKTMADRYKYADYAEILFSDNGVGFDNRYRDYVFLLLKKLQSDTPGLGFGLALCKKIVDNHYGSITADSTPGEGTTFTIILPLKQPG
jgi:sigma-B regulation protein RsbU (phosphoserine phosphatase)